MLLPNIHHGLSKDGVFASIDMIGRNGHMRWPEALEEIERVWKFIPDQWKYNFQLQAYFDTYVNHDCSTVGFEGVRAQDILGILVDTFCFTGFVQHFG